jgi:hypothetical protein
MSFIKNVSSELSIIRDNYSPTACLQLKNKRLLIYRVCVIKCATKYLNAKFKEDRYFVNEVETRTPSITYDIDSKS